MRTLAQDYMRAWLEEDESLFLRLLTPDVYVVESYGPAYRGLDECRAWFRDWHAAPNSGRVLKWDMGSQFHDDAANVLFCQWTFECRYADKVGGFEGASLYKIRDGLIFELHEFKTEGDQYRPYRGSAA